MIVNNNNNIHLLFFTDIQQLMILVNQYNSDVEITKSTGSFRSIFFIRVAQLMILIQD
jgi:hypothetical protein